MRTNNGLPNITLEDVQVTVNVTDENGNPVTATSNSNAQPDLSDPNAPRFFIRLDDLQNVSNAQIDPNHLDFSRKIAARPHSPLAG